MSLIFVDTSCWLALVTVSDSLHEGATEVYEGLVAQQRRFITHQAVFVRNW
jgi:predicted nucleic acid-binding protein